jgi:hypothetical protein
MKKSFDDWMKDVDRYVGYLLGLSYLDLPDAPFRDWYDDGLAPLGAAKKLKKAALRGD